MLELLALAGLLVDEDDLEPPMQIGLCFETIRHTLRIESSPLAENLRIGPEMNRGAALAGLPSALELCACLSSYVWLRIGFAPAPNRGLELRRERIDDGGAHAVEAPCNLIALPFELTARMQGGEDELERRLLELGMGVDRNAAPVVGDRRTVVILVENDFDAGGMPIDRFIDRVVEDLPEQMMVAVRVSPADIHRRTFANGLQAFENIDVFGGVRH